MENKPRQIRKCSQVHAEETPALNSIKLGEVLVRVGRIKTEDLEQALREQDASKKRIGEVLIEKGFITPEELTHGMNVQSILTTSGIPAGLSFGSALEGGSSQAYEEKKAGAAKAQAPIRSHLAVLYQLPSIILSRDDIKAGYIILEKVTRIAIKSNNKQGCLVVFTGLKWPFKEAHAFGLAHDVHITQEGASVQQPYKKQTQNVELSYRFILSVNAKAGRHPWPLSIALQPL
jgi:hypothetical protein